MAAAPLRPIRSDTMKSNFRFALLLLLPAASLTACVTGNKGYVRIPSDLTDITLIGTNPKEITLEASDDWYVRIFYEEGDTLRWLNATPLSGRADETSVTLTAKTPNYTTQPRRAEVQFKLPGDAGTIIRVTQQISPKPQPLTHLTRSLSGATLEGPAELTFQYDEELENTPVFSDGTTTYTLTRGTSNGTIATTTSGGTGSFSYTAVNGRITALGPLQWEFRDRNTGIWRNISLYATGRVALRHPFVKSELRKPGYDQSRQTVSVEVVNPSTSNSGVTCKVKGEIVGENITFEKTVKLLRGAQQVVTFSPEDFPQLVIDKPRLWWPVNKGPQNLYDLKLTVSVNNTVCDSVKTRFGIREITSDTKTPDKSRVFYVNGKRLFIRGTNWIPEAMCRTSDERTYAELRYTRQSGVNLVRMWGGGIAESDYFFQLCDELGLLVWQEFWMTGDTRHPNDRGNYLENVASTVKRIRNHPSLAYYVASNESTETTGTPELLNKLDGTRGYQMQSECAGVHDGSPYKQVNPMRHYENTASDRGSRVDGFNPEYGAPTLPLVEILREMMDESDLWPINKEVWDYLDGNGFHLMTTLYTDLVNQYGESSSIDEFAKKAQLVGAMNSKSIWEVWNYNKLDYGDRFCSGLLFWYHNCPVRQVCARMWDWSLEPTASLYHTANSLEPLHAQFDYLKNTVSVVNDYYQAFNNYKVIAQVYNMDSKKVLEESAVVNLPEDGVVNDAITLRFPENISQVHFIRLVLQDEKGNEVSSNFYWRSKDKYEGKKTVTGPAASGFADLNNMKPSKVKLTYKTREENGRYFVDITLKNTAKTIAFFNQLQLLDAKMSPIRPSFYTDNFFTLMPGEKKSVTIETAVDKLSDTAASLVLKGWNIERKEFKLK